MGAHLTPSEVVQRANMALSDMTTGHGHLLPKQLEQYRDYAYEVPVTLNKCTRVMMDRETQEFPKVGITDTVYTTPPAAYAAQSADMSARFAWDYVQLVAKQYQGTVRVPMSTFLQSVEKEGFKTTILRHLGSALARDMNRALLNGDTAAVHADAKTQGLLRVQNGVIKQVTTNVHNNLGVVLSEDTFDSVERLIPDKYVQQGQDWTFVVPRKIALDWRKLMRQRGTELGDRTMVTGQIPDFGVSPVIWDPHMPVSALEATILYANLKSIWWGLMQNVTVQSEAKIEEQYVVFVALAWCAFGLEWEDALAKGTRVLTT